MKLPALRRIDSNPHAVVAVVAVVVAAGAASPQCAQAARPTLPTEAFHVAAATCQMPLATQPAQQATAVNPQLPARKMAPGVQ